MPFCLKRVTFSLVCPFKVFMLFFEMYTFFNVLVILV